MAKKGEGSAKTIDPGSCSMTFSRGVERKRDMYDGKIEGVKKAVYHSVEKNELSKAWYEFALQHTSPYLLRMYAKTEETPNRYLLFTESFDCTFKEWTDKHLKNDHVMDESGNGCLHERLIQVISDILKGICYFHVTLNRPHGDICPENIFIINGRAKLGNVVDIDFCSNSSFNEDYLGFGSTMAPFLHLSEIYLPIFELKELCHLLKRTHPTRCLSDEDKNNLLHNVNHPCLLNPIQRYWYRFNSQTFLHDNHSIRRGNREMKSLFESNPNWYRAWTQFVDNEGEAFVKVFTHNNDHGYTNEGSSFLRYSRNVCEHLCDHDASLSYENINHGLNNIWPEFMLVLHAILGSLQIFPFALEKP